MNKMCEVFEFCVMSLTIGEKVNSIMQQYVLLVIESGILFTLANSNK